MVQQDFAHLLDVQVLEQLPRLLRCIANEPAKGRVPLKVLCEGHCRREDADAGRCALQRHLPNNQPDQDDLRSDAVTANAKSWPCDTHLHNGQHIVGLRLDELIVLGLGRDVLDECAGPDAVRGAVTVIQNTWEAADELRHPSRR